MTIRKSIRVSPPPEAAFRLLVAEIGAWWPLQQGYSYGHECKKDIFLEARVGGRFYERFTDGTEFEIGRVTAYHPPRSVVLTWKDPDWEDATEVEVRFIAEGGGTRVEVEHRGWEKGPIMQKQGKGFADGWTMVLAAFIDKASA